MLMILDDLQQRTHDKWASWTTAEIQKYLKKYHNAPIIRGKCSSHRRKKIKFLQILLAQRQQAEALILAGL